MAAQRTALRTLPRHGYLVQNGACADKLAKAEETRNGDGGRADGGGSRCRSWRSGTCGCTSPPTGVYADREIPIIVRGEGCYVFDEHGKRYLDGLAALFCVNIGHGRADVAQAGADQAKELGFFTNWTYAHPKAIELAARVAELAPGDLNRVFFTSGGSEAVDSALKLCRQYHKLTGNAGRYKVISRKIAYHGTTMGALTATGITGRARAVRADLPGLGARAEHEPVPARGRATRPRRSASGSSSRGPRPSRA